MKFTQSLPAIVTQLLSSIPVPPFLPATILLNIRNLSVGTNEAEAESSHRSLHLAPHSPSHPGLYSRSTTSTLPLSPAYYSYTVSFESRYWTNLPGSKVICFE